MNVKNQVLNLSGEKIKSLVLVENGIRLSNQPDSNIDDFNKNWGNHSVLTANTEIPFKKLANITQVVGTDTLAIHYETSFGIPAVKKIIFQNNKDQQAFYQFFQKEKGFVKTDKKISCLESTMNYWIPLAIILLLTWFAYNEAMKLSSGQYAPPEDISDTTRFFQFILEIVGAGGIVCIGFGLATYCVYKGWKHYFNPPVVSRLELVKKK
jgi:hypothetical protein